MYSGIFSCVCTYLRRPEVNPGVSLRHCSPCFWRVSLSLTWILLRHNHLLLLPQPWIYKCRQPCPALMHVQAMKVQSTCLQGKHLLTEPSVQSINPFDMAIIQCIISSFKAYSYPRDPSLFIPVKFTKKTSIP